MPRGPAGDQVEPPPSVVAGLEGPHLHRDTVSAGHLGHPRVQLDTEGGQVTPGETHGGLAGATEEARIAKELLRLTRARRVGSPDQYLLGLRTLRARQLFRSTCRADLVGCLRDRPGLELRGRLEDAPDQIESREPCGSSALARRSNVACSATPADSVRVLRSSRAYGYS